MKNRLLIPLVLYIFTMGGAVAQQMYKSVGPDGKVTYSDRPPDTASAKLSVMKAYAMHPVDTLPATLSNVAASAVKADPGSLRSGKSAKAGGARTVPEEVEKAVTGVMVLADLLRRSEELCVSTLPTSTKRYGGVYGKWKDRNATFLDKQHRILMEVISPARRASIQQAVGAVNDHSLTQIRAASTAARVTWCNKGFEDMDAGRQDIANNPALSVPLITFTPG